MKVPELLPRFLSIGSRGLYVPLERVIRHFLTWLFPTMEIAECTAFRVTRDADFAVSDEADDLLEAVEFELRRRRFGEAVRLEISGSSSARMLAQLKDGLGVEDDQVYLVPGLLGLADLSELAQLDRPDLKDEPWVPVVPARFATNENGELFDGDPAQPGARAPPLRLVRPHVRGVHALRGGRPPSGRREDERLPHERRFAARARADRGGRGRQADGLPRRAEGALRRATQHRMVANARVRRRPRRLRVPDAEDPRQGHARRPPRGGRPAPLRAHRDRQLQRGHGAPL